MNIDKYKETVMSKLASMTEDEIYQLLLDSGLEDCPYEHEDEIIVFSGECQVEMEQAYFLDTVTKDCFDNFKWYDARLAA